VELHPESVSRVDGVSEMVLHWACYYNSFIETSLEVVKFLYEQCPEAISARAFNGELPLHYAVQQSDLPERASIVQFLIDK